MIVSLLLVAISIVLVLASVKAIDVAIGYYDTRTQKADERYERFLRQDKQYISRFNGLDEELNSLPFKYLSFAIWGYKDKKGKFVNIKNGFRRTYSSCVGKSPKKIIWFFGGSTMFGRDPDEYTIPSVVCKILNKKYSNQCWECQNFGIAAYVNNQEVILFFKLLQKASKKDYPDYVVFYDGVNDFIVSLQEYPYDHHNFTGVKKIYEDSQDRFCREFMRR